MRMVRNTSLMFLVGCTSLLSGCATLSPKAVSPNAIQQDIKGADTVQLNKMFDTAQDNQQLVWHNADGNTLYQMVTTNTSINDQGQPCHNYTLIVAPSYQRKQTSTGTACRDDNGQWQFNSN
jgi:hypothetical protein